MRFRRFTGTRLKNKFEMYFRIHNRDELRLTLLPYVLNISPHIFRKWQNHLLTDSQQLNLDEAIIILETNADIYIQTNVYECLRQLLYCSQWNYILFRFFMDQGADICLNYEEKECDKESVTQKEEKEDNTKPFHLLSRIMHPHAMPLILVTLMYGQEYGLDMKYEWNGFLLIEKAILERQFNHLIVQLITALPNVALTDVRWTSRIINPLITQLTTEESKWRLLDPQPILQTLLSLMDVRGEGIFLTNDLISETKRVMPSLWVRKVQQHEYRDTMIIIARYACMQIFDPNVTGMIIAFM